MRSSLPGAPNLGRLAGLALFVLTMACGCHRHATAQTGIVPSDPQIASNLATLSHELRRAMPHYKLTRSFDDFVAQTRVEVPAPPPGQKYAINEKWKVILVDSKDGGAHEN